MICQYKITFTSYTLHLLEFFCVKLHHILNSSIAFKKIRYKSQTVEINKTTVLSSPHVNKKAQDQFETRSYSRIFLFQLPTTYNEKILLILNQILKKASPLLFLNVEITCKS